jgi:DNA-binding phage protein
MIPCDRPCAAKLVCKPVANSGTVYRCAAVLAAAKGVTRFAVYQALYRNGDAEAVGRPRKGGNNCTPVKIGKYAWPSISHLARDLGMNRSHIDKMIRRYPERVVALVMKAKG